MRNVSVCTMTLHRRHSSRQRSKVKHDDTFKSCGKLCKQKEKRHIDCLLLSIDLFWPIRALPAAAAQSSLPVSVVLPESSTDLSLMKAFIVKGQQEMMLL